jgi:toxin-antitoxin system PIN domain toxin
LIAPDANLLIYAHSPTSPDYRASRAWFEDLLSGTNPVGIPDLCTHAFLRFITNPKLAASPLSFEDAVRVVDRWFETPHVISLFPTERHWMIMASLAEKSRARGANLTDAFIAAIAIEHGAVVHTADRDFARFPGVRWHNPLAS